MKGALSDDHFVCFNETWMLVLWLMMISFQIKTYYLLGLITPSGRLTSMTSEKAKTKFDSIFNLKESHSIADTLWNHGLEKPSTRRRLVYMKRPSWSKARIDAAPAKDSEKWWRIGVICICAKRASSLAVGV